MPLYTQSDRPLRFETPLGDDVLLPTGFSGTEAVSAPFSFRVELVSEDRAIDPKKLLRKPVVIRLELPDGGERLIHGLVRRFVQLGRDDDLTSYQAEVVPWLWFLGLTREYRIFQKKAVPEILEEVFAAQGFTDYRVDTSGTYPKREFCVQYGESDLDFVSRLMEEEGLFYFFEHASSAHTLVVADTNSAFKPCPEPGASVRVVEQSAPDEDAVLSIRAEHGVHAGTVTLRDWVYPMVKSVEASQSGEGREELYDFAVGLDDNDATSSALQKKPDEVRRYATFRLEAEEAAQHVVQGDGTCRAFVGGHTFKLREHYRSDLNQEYVLTSVRHTARASSYHSLRQEAFEYRNSFVAIPASVPYRPPLRTPKPVVRGSQTAIVVGPQGEEIYTDEHARVKVQFHWDRNGKRDDASSCWVRVATTWAGKGWGAVRIPRIGQEVVVDFLDGDPDRPIIVGSVYNPEQVPPYKLPDNRTVSGIKSRSSPKGGASEFNELRFEDKKGEEEVHLQAQKDLNAVVKNNETRTVGLETKDPGDQTITIHNNQTTTLKEGTQATKIEKGDQTVKIAQGKRTIDIDQGDDKLTLGQGGQLVDLKQGTQQTTLGMGDQQVDIKQGKQVVKLGMGDQVVDLQMGNQSITLAMGNQTTTLKMGNQTTKLNLGKSTLETLQGIELKVGQNSIKIDQTGVTIKGMMVKIEGTIQAEVKGLMTQVKGTAMLQAQGAITMIN